jgi:hypothetical protein
MQMTGKPAAKLDKSAKSTNTFPADNIDTAVSLEAASGGASPA